MAGFNERCKIKKALNNRLKSEGKWPGYNELRAALKQAGVAESDAWRVAAYVFPPANGSPPEIAADPKYAEIVEGWTSGRYAVPESAVVAAASPNTVAADQTQSWDSAWEALAIEVADRQSNELDCLRWVVANWLVNVKRLKVDEIPSTSALSILKFAQMSPSNFGELLRTNLPRLLPDQKTLEDRKRFVDDGRDLELIEEFQRALDAEEAAAASQGGTHANSR